MKQLSERNLCTDSGCHIISSSNNDECKSFRSFGNVSKKSGSNLSEISRMQKMHLIDL